MYAFTLTNWNCECCKKSFLLPLNSNSCGRAGLSENIFAFIWGPLTSCTKASSWNAIGCVSNVLSLSIIVMPYISAVSYTSFLQERTVEKRVRLKLR